MKTKKSLAEKILKLDNFLKEPKTAEEIKKELKNKLGYNVDIMDIRVNLLYLLRREKIRRQKKEGESYRYHIYLIVYNGP